LTLVENSHASCSARSLTSHTSLSHTHTQTIVSLTQAHKQAVGAHKVGTNFVAETKLSHSTISNLDRTRSPEFAAKRHMWWRWSRIALSGPYAMLRQGRWRWDCGVRMPRVHVHVAHRANYFNPTAPRILAPIYVLTYLHPLTRTPHTKPHIYATAHCATAHWRPGNGVMA
jgi:hypothetical protein